MRHRTGTQEPSAAAPIIAPAGAAGVTMDRGPSTVDPKVYVGSVETVAATVMIFAMSGVVTLLFAMIILMFAGFFDSEWGDMR